MVGVAAGDAMGDIGRDKNANLNQADSYRFRYGIITEMYDGAASTDDTEFTVLSARTILDNKGVLTHQNVAESWKKLILAHGGMKARGGRPLYGAVENLKRGILPPQSGIDNVFNTDDGAAMRIAPVGIVYAGNPTKAAEVARFDAEMSHANSGVWAAQAIASAISVAMADGSTEEICNAMMDPIPKNSWLGRQMEKVKKLCDSASDMEEIWSALHCEFYTREHAAVEEAIPEIYGVSRMTNFNYRKGMFWGANFGRDADTIAAVVGALAGAKEGIEVIPESWIAPVRQPAGTCLEFAGKEDVVDLGTALAQLGMELAD